MHVAGSYYQQTNPRVCGCCQFFCLPISGQPGGGRSISKHLCYKIWSSYGLAGGRNSGHTCLCVHSFSSSPPTVNMDRASPSFDNTVSLMRVIDGSHLVWSEFRTAVLAAFQIVLADDLQFSHLSRPLADRLKVSLQDLGRFTHQQRQWRDQVDNGKGFGPTLLFPPNVLPPLRAHTHLQRCLTPKMPREALPPRVTRARDSLFELPAPRPGLLTGFTPYAFNERELSILPNCVSTTGTVVDFVSGCVSPGTTAYCPFLVFERMRVVSDDAVQAAKNQCAIAGAHCVRAFQMLFKRCCGPIPALDKPIAFSCALDNSVALINHHSVDSEGRYYMSEMSRFNLEDTDGFNEFQAWIEAIEQWGLTYILPIVKIALQQHLKGNFTPPISPMPSLTLSIDTAPGGEEILMKILRATYGSIKWKCDGEYETPLNSSIAHCGTPFGARNIRTMALSPATPADVMSAVSGRSGFISTWRMKPDYSARSPVQRRLLPPSPLRLKHDFPDSPVRRATLSPCSPPPDAPWTAKSPMLVLQRRMDLAMDEIQELRTMVQILQRELQTENHAAEPAQKQHPKATSIANEDWISTPTAPTLTSPISWNEALDRAMHLQAFEAQITPVQARVRDVSFPGIHLIFMALSWLLHADMLESFLNVIAAYATWSLILHMVERAGTASDRLKIFTKPFLSGWDTSTE